MDTKENLPVRVGPAPQKTPAGNDEVARKFRGQPCEHLPGDYQFTDDDRAAVSCGRELNITGKVVAELDAFAEKLGRSEGFAYLTASAECPELISGLIVPCQRAGSTHCHVEPDAVLAVGREARKNGQIVISASHSHGDGETYSSGIDRGQVQDFAQEGIGWACRQSQSATAEGKVGPADSLEVVSPFDADQRVVIKCTCTGHSTEHGVQVEFHRVENSLVSVFGTTNARGHHWFLAVRSKRCPECGSITEVPLAGPPKVRIVGEIPSLSAGQLAELHRQIKERVKSYGYYYWDHGYRGDEDDYRCGGKKYGDSLREKDHGVSDSGHAYAEDMTDDEAGPPPYQVWHRGRLIGRIAASVLEEASAKVGSLAAALGWGSKVADTQAQDTVQEAQDADGNAE